MRERREREIAQVVRCFSQSGNFCEKQRQTVAVRAQFPHVPQHKCENRKPHHAGNHSFWVLCGTIGEFVENRQDRGMNLSDGAGPFARKAHLAFRGLATRNNRGCGGHGIAVRRSRLLVFDCNDRHCKILLGGKVKLDGLYLCEQNAFPGVKVESRVRQNLDHTGVFLHAVRRGHGILWSEFSRATLICAWNPEK